MKKLIAMFVTVALVSFSQGASVNWTISNVYHPGSSADKVAKATCTAYLFVTENSTDVSLTTTSLAAVQAILDSGDLTGLAGLSAVNKNNTGDGLWSGATGLTGFSSGTLEAFAVVVDSSDASTANHYLLVSGGTTKSVSFSSATGAKALVFGDQTAVSQGGWHSVSVPEPSSGLLFLFGLAGLALRRKHA